jgi:hypothetical protein
VGTKSTVTLPERIASEGEASGIFREPIVVGITPTPVYSFTINSIQIKNPRSLINDTDYVSCAIVVGNNPPITAPVKSMGNLGDGTYAVGLTIPNVPVGPNDAMAFSYSILNTGYSSDIVEQALQKASSAAASKAGAAAAAAIGGAVGGPLGSVLAAVGSAAFGWVTSEVLGFIFPDCDGPVAAGDHAYTGAQLAAQTANGTGITMTDYSAGTNSPDGCGANSKYYVTWSVSTQPPATGGGHGPGGGGGGETGPGNPPHRLD